MKSISKIFLLLMVIISSTAVARTYSSFPRIHKANPDTILSKIARNNWANEIYERIKNHVDPYVNRHVEEPDWITSRMAMYWGEGEHYTQCYVANEVWQRGEGNAPVPTVRMPGMRTWNQYVNVPLEMRTPYNTTGDMLGHSRVNNNDSVYVVPYRESGHMIRSNNVEILTLGEESALMYWLTGEEKYARFSADIFYTWLIGTYYMNPFIDISEGGVRKEGNHPGGIAGYYDYEQIHDDLGYHAALIYDFAHDYLVQNPYKHLKDIGISLDDMAAVVFKRFVDIGMVRGGKSSNWNVNGWNMMLNPILVLDNSESYEDGHGADHYLHFLLEETTDYHDAIPEILKSYDSVTGLWPESPGYAFGVIGMLLNFQSVLAARGIDIIADNEVMQRAALASIPWMDSRANMIVFGDSRGGAANFDTFEKLLAYYSEKNDTANISLVASVIEAGINSGNYNRGNSQWTALFSYVDSVPSSSSSSSSNKPVNSWSDFHRLATMKNNGSDLMSVLYGGRKGSHLSPNGLALQLYGNGYALAPDAAAYVSYWSDDQIYHQTATGSNTILPGYSEGDITVNFIEPFIEEGEFTSSESLAPFINIADISAGEKRRLVAMISGRNDNNKGYYVDIFRSNLEDNDYLFHIVGDTILFFDNYGNKLNTKRTNKFEKTYGKGYEWFENINYVPFNDDFKVIWHITDSLSMTMWMPGAENRTLYSFDAPYTTLNKGLTPDNVSSAPDPTPSIIIRQDKNNAWSNPYIAVFDASNTVAGIKKTIADDNTVVIDVKETDGSEDMLLYNINSSKGIKTEECEFVGTFGMVGKMPNGSINRMYMINGRLLNCGEFSIKSNKEANVSVYKTDNQWYYSSDNEVEIMIGDVIIKADAAYNKSIK